MNFLKKNNLGCNQNVMIAFEKLKEALIIAPILVYPIFGL